MPELPEVETLVRNLRELLRGVEFSAVVVCWPGAVAMPSAGELARELPGRKVLDVSRRGKFLLFSLSGPGYLLCHLRMSGQLRVEAGPDLPDNHVRLIFHLGDGRRLVFSDTRKFGRVYWVSDPNLVVGALGPEPLDDGFTVQRLSSLLLRRKSALKSLLLNQEVLAGLGNIYADEVLFRSRLHPLRKAHTLSPTEVQRLYLAIREVLQQAIEQCGTTLADARFRDAEGRPGRFVESLRVYQHTGEPCACCGTLIERILVGGRGTHFCPSCQRGDGGQRCTRGASER